ncbi:MAG: L-histidine N(alpha)-methyltransferase [Microthrixaceae bacterium]
MIRNPVEPLTDDVSDDPVLVLLTAAQLRESLLSEVALGLQATPKELSPKWLYDDYGCELFGRITELTQYYPTRAERSILQNHAANIQRLSLATTLIELGSGTSEKTRLVLNAFDATQSLEQFVAFDVAEPTLRDAVGKIQADFPETKVQGIVGDFTQHLSALPVGGVRMIVFLGGTIGNFPGPQRNKFLAEVAQSLQPGDSLLLGTDLIKDRSRLVAAYDDTDGVTAAFNKNLLSVLNTELRGEFDLDLFRHVALFNEADSCIEMRLRSVTDQQIALGDLGLLIEFSAGEDLLTEISTKFSEQQVQDELQAAGFSTQHCWKDDAGDFALWLAMR